MISQSQPLQQSQLRWSWLLSSLWVYLSASSQLPKLEGDNAYEHVSEGHSAHSCSAVACGSSTVM